MKWSSGAAAGCAVVFAALCIAVATDLATRNASTSAAPGASQTAAAPDGLVPAPTGSLSRGPVVAPVHPKTLLSVDGTGAGRTVTFTTGTDWYLRYSYDCPESVHEGRTTLEIFAYSAEDQGRPIASESELSGTDILPQHGLAGPRYLRVTSLCDWTVTVIG
jgi:hypothetical protein